MAPILLPDLDLQRLRRFCARRAPDHLRDEVRLELTVRGSRVTVLERRPPYLDRAGDWTSRPIAQLRYDGMGRWTLFFRNRQGGWTEYFDLAPGQPMEVIINEIDNDPTAAFWG
jgi:hypothetical protein